MISSNYAKKPRLLFQSDYFLHDYYGVETLYGLLEKRYIKLNRKQARLSSEWAGLIVRRERIK